jgi:ATP-binding cassette subfamily C protein LapB
MIVATIAAGAVLVLQGQVTAGALVATLLLSGRMMQMIQRGLVLWLKYQDYLLSRDKVRSIFEVPVTKKSDAELGDIRPQGNLRAEALTYRWRDDEKPVIDNVSFELRPGDLVCIAGEEAAGKTTLLNLLAGIAPATSGEVTVDDVNIQRLSPERLTRHVGYITAEPVIFRGTIRNNITRFGELEDRYARKFAALLGIDKDVAKMPTGFDTFLQGGSNDVIPPGLRQRIAMARVLAARPRILLLDEAETALDREGYELFMSLLEKMRDEVAIVVTSEDPRILMLANRHYALRNGKLVPLPPPSRRPTPFPLS